MGFGEIRLVLQTEVVSKWAVKSPSVVASLLERPTGAVDWDGTGFISTGTYQLYLSVHFKTFSFFCPRLSVVTMTIFL